MILQHSHDRMYTEKLRSGKAFNLFWHNVTDSSETHGVGEPHLPRSHKMPKRYENGNAVCEFHNEEKNLFSSALL